MVRTLGHSSTMTLVLGAFGARLLLYSLLTNPWFSLMVEVLNGITFGIFYATMTSYAHLISPPGQVTCLSFFVDPISETKLTTSNVLKHRGGEFLLCKSETNMT